MPYLLLAPNPQLGTSCTGHPGRPGLAMAQHAVSVMPQTHGRLVRRAVLSNGMWSTSGPHRPCPASQPQGPLVPGTACTGAYPQPHVPSPFISLGTAGQPQPCMHHAGHTSQLRDLPCHPHTRHSHARPTPLGPLVETGAPCSEAVLLRGVIKRPEDVGAQALSGWSRSELELGELALEAPACFFPAHLSASPRYAAHRG